MARDLSWFCTCACHFCKRAYNSLLNVIVSVSSGLLFKNTSVSSAFCIEFFFLTQFAFLLYVTACHVVPKMFDPLSFGYILTAYFSLIQVKRYAFHVQQFAVLSPWQKAAFIIIVFSFMITDKNILPAENHYNWDMEKCCLFFFVKSK